MTKLAEPTTVGLSEGAHSKLQKLKESGHFSEMVEAYRFAIAFALSRGEISGRIKTKTIFNVGTLDPEQELYVAIGALRESEEEPVYRTAERLAEWGVEELYRRVGKGEISIEELLMEAGEKLQRLR
jgi:Arc/MetJ-type ribon-helix-helix transcriptional regulator